MVENQKSKFWLDLAVDEIIKRYPRGEIILSSGISPSADYHIGHFREILTTDAMTWGLRKAGRKATHIHVVDNFDPLRKRYDFLPRQFDKHVGKPIGLIPDPKGSCHKSYADHFYAEFEKYAQNMGIYPDRIVRSYEDLYKSGKMTNQIEAVLSKIDVVNQIYKELANRELESQWTPIQALDKKQQFFNTTLDSWNQKQKTIGSARYDQGEAKLSWRLDWPARWQLLSVMVEPFGRELASAGSAHDTGVEFARKVFGFKPPIPGVSYEPVHLAGDSRKMSSSLGNLVTPAEALKIMPPEVLRYFVIRSRPDHKLYFDSGEGLYNLVDEFSQVEADPDHEFKDAYKFAVDIRKGTKRTISNVPFKHLVSVYQAALKNPKLVPNILERTGYGEEVNQQKDVILGELKYIENWLSEYAPEEVKFQIQDKLPKVKLDVQQKQFLRELANNLEQMKHLEAQAIHEKIYELMEKFKLKPAQAFKAIYWVILNKDSGPKAGWFLASLDKPWLLKRLKLEA